ncbi:MAG TPA: glycoside hydrolase family 15 protein [Solirubrobacteraceae bacterium]|jgi:GH15 family glucan-1,4-alpha-glucosidase|nr:glycoside hydrolase family 15 protein [Solirubrobacteraceae bacterium]
MSTVAQNAERGLALPHVLREYALLADGERGVLVGPRGDFSWMCFPRWHDDAIFSALIGGRSSYALAPRGRFVWGGYYEPGSLIWRSRWITETGIVESREALALPSDARSAVLLRRVIAVRGDAHLDVRLNPGPDFDRHHMSSLRQHENGDWHARLQQSSMRWSGAARARALDDGHRGRELSLELHVKEGEHHDLLLALDEGEEQTLASADQLWRSTTQAWQERVPGFAASVAPRDARHAYAVLSGLTSQTGGMVAAATTSLPERAERGRNYDYRYAWIRDQAYCGQAVAASGPHALMGAAVDFVTARLLEDGDQLSPAYTIDGAQVPRQRQLDLPGYPGGSDIVGNWVREQFQLDAFGEILLLLAAASRHGDLSSDAWQAALIAAAAIEARWREPDAGIWEIDPAPWTHSRLISAAGLRAISAFAPGRELAPRWLALADAIVADTSAHALHPDGFWQRSPSDPGLDASLLLAGIRGALPADDPRTLRTLEAVSSKLTEDGYCYRFDSEGLPLGQAEGAFLLCGFWMSLAYWQQGEHLQSARWFERNRSACGPPGLLSEEFDVTQRQLRGNLPQAFVHALLLECAVREQHSGQRPCER